MSADCALNIMPTGDFVDNAEWPQKSIYAISSSCDNRTPSAWYINETDEDGATQVSMVAPIAADAALQTINESGDFTEEHNKICIHDLSKDINGHLPTTDECEDAGTTILQREFNAKKYYRTGIYGTNRCASMLQDNIQDKNSIYDHDMSYNKVLKKKTSKYSSFGCFENDDYFGRNFNSKTLQTIPINITDKMDDTLNKNIYKHVPHKDRPPLIVARRNARERRRVQAVNSAFMRLRKMVPLGNNRGKRISKVKTLQTAIEYISSLQSLLKETDIYDLDIISEYRCPSNYHYSLDDFHNKF